MDYQSMPEERATAQAVAAIAELDIYNRQMRINERLAAIEERLKSVRDHEERIRQLEASRAKLIGAAVALSAIAGTLGTWLGLIIAHH